MPEGAAVVGVTAVSGVPPVTSAPAVLAVLSSTAAPVLPEVPAVSAVLAVPAALSALTVPVVPVGPDAPADTPSEPVMLPNGSPAVTASLFCAQPDNKITQAAAKIEMYFFILYLSLKFVV